ncbi:hypothetical protein EVAR_26107_1 [Eumeta japonica]|uniref:Uncharacterized protein n=1 Tax=Eumeta variegata TaxID=151549 RepID=A0A4C1WX72_EUMVA|nr:hypothetical protein EVAR_26107_1 [Eumeta japonica]
MVPLSDNDEESDQLNRSYLDQLNQSGLDLKIYLRSEIVRSRQFVRGPSTPLFLGVQVPDGGLMLPHARMPSRREYDPDGLVVMALFQRSKLG